MNDHVILLYTKHGTFEGRVSHQGEPGKERTDFPSRHPGMGIDLYWFRCMGDDGQPGDWVGLRADDIQYVTIVQV